MLKLNSAADIAAAAFAVALGLLAFGQYRASTAFADGAIRATAQVVDLRTEKRAVLDAQAETFAQVEFAPSGSEPSITSELPTPIRALGLDAETAIGKTLPIYYDPKNPASVRHGGAARGAGGALVLLALAVGALFIPSILRRSSLARMATGGGG